MWEVKVKHGFTGSSSQGFPSGVAFILNSVGSGVRVSEDRAILKKLRVSWKEMYPKSVPVFLSLGYHLHNPPSIPVGSWPHCLQLPVPLRSPPCPPPPSSMSSAASGGAPYLSWLPAGPPGQLVLLWKWQQPVLHLQWPVQHSGGQRSHLSGKDTRPSWGEEWAGNRMCRGRKGERALSTLCKPTCSWRCGKRQRLWEGVKIHH